MSTSEADHPAVATPSAEKNIKVKVLNLAGTDLAEILVSTETLVHEIKRELYVKTTIPSTLQCLCYGDQTLDDSIQCGSLGWKDHDEISIYLTRLSLDIDTCLATLWSPGPSGTSKAAALDLQEMEKLCAVCKEIFKKEPMLLEPSAGLTVVGNIHGHFDQLLDIFQRFGIPGTDADPLRTAGPIHRYLFLGGYVDKGRRSLDAMSLLFLYKAQQPENIFLLRSNHEDAQICRMYGFYDECKRKCNVKLWKRFVDVFNHMPVCALVNQKIFCVHGGISSELKSLDQIRNLERPTVVPDSGLLCDLLWADPSHGSGWGESDRGVSFTFGADVTHEFLQNCGVDLIVRSHEMLENGYTFHASEKVVTLWSLLRFKEMDEPQTAAVMVISEDGGTFFELFRDR